MIKSRLVRLAWCTSTDATILYSIPDALLVLVTYCSYRSGDFFLKGWNATRTRTLAVLDVDPETGMVEDNNKRVPNL